MLKVLLFIAGCALAGTAAAQYKWVDKNGRVQYGDTPPPGVAAAPLRAAPAPVPQPATKTSPPEAKSLAEKEAEFRKRRLEAEKDREKQAQAEQQAAERRDNCTRSQEMARTLETGRVARTDARGERYYLDDRQIEQEKVKARQLVQQWCG